MKRLLKIAAATLLCCSFICMSMLGVEAETPSPYSLISGGGVTGMEMLSSQTMGGGLNYYTANVTSHIQGLTTRDAIPYLTYGAIGTKETFWGLLPNFF